MPAMHEDTHTKIKKQHIIKTFYPLTARIEMVTCY